VLAHVKAEKHSEMELEFNKRLFEDAGFIVYEKTLRQIINDQNKE